MTVPAALVRPRRPPRSAFALIACAAAAALTLLAMWDWKYGIGFSFRSLVTEITRKNAVIEGLLHPNWGQALRPRTRQAFIETLYIAVLGTTGGAVVALPLALWSTRFGAPITWFRVVVRALTNVIRAVPDILWALLFVALVGIKALPGILALFFFSIAVITKLTADTLDGIDMGPLEAADAAGARHHQMLRLAVVPQILPTYVSFVLYAFEVNVRSSVVLGLVGAGGIGERLDFFSANLRWDAVWGIVVLFFAVVFVIERFSTWLRRRLV